MAYNVTGKLDVMPKLTPTTLPMGIQALAGIDLGHDSMRRSLESIKSMERVALAGLGLREEANRSLDSIKSAQRMTELAGLSGPSAKRLMLENINSAQGMTPLAGFSIRDELKRSLEHTSLLANNVDRAIAKMPIPDPRYDMLRTSLKAEFPVPPRNPIWETNRQLAELTDTVTQLVDVSRQQAELSQAIRNTSDLALENSIQSGEEAKAATRLARKSLLLTIIVSIIIAVSNIAITIYVNQRGDANAEARRQEETRLLRDISSQLKVLGGKASLDPTVKPQSSQPLNTLTRASKGSASHQ